MTIIGQTRKPCDDYEGHLKPWGTCLNCGFDYNLHKEYRDELERKERQEERELERDEEREDK